MKKTIWLTKDTDGYHHVFSQKPHVAITCMYSKYWYGRDVSFLRSRTAHIIYPPSRHWKGGPQAIVELEIGRKPK